MSKIALRTTFNADAERYHIRRPGYPSALFEKLISDTHLSTKAELLEIGPGTGQATKPLAERGYHITAIELGEDLSAKAREVLADYSNVDIIAGAFEDVELPSEHYDLVYSATAIHWIRPDFKFAKPHQLLKPNGYLAILVAVMSLQYFFSHGGTLGGFGASSEEYFVEPTTAYTVFGYCLVGAALIIDIVVGVVVYRRVRAKSKSVHG